MEAEILTGRSISETFSKIILLVCAISHICLANSEIISARISKNVCDSHGQYIGEMIDHEYQKDFSQAFKNIDLHHDGLETEDGVFGIPISMIVIYEDGIYLVTMNNSYGIFSVDKAQKTAGGLYTVSYDDHQNSRDIYLPQLYRNLKNMGINILSIRDLNYIFNLSKGGKSSYLKNYKKCVE